MKAVIQRVRQASVRLSGDVLHSHIGPGILTLLSFKVGDTDAQAEKIIRKIIQLRIFNDESGKMNHSLLETKGSHLIVSQFTLYGDTSQGRRPGFSQAERPEKAKPLFEFAIRCSRKLGVPTESGIFQAEMLVEIQNDGPLTFILEEN